MREYTTRGHGETREKFVMEKRHADGTLDLSEPQAPFFVCTEDMIFRHYFVAHPCTDAACKTRGNCRCTATQGAVRAWYAGQGFTWRRKTW
jgi:hypothetical protein